MEPILKTKRLVLRNLAREDAPVIHGYRNDERCYVYQRWEDTSLAAVHYLIEASMADVFLSDKEEQHYAIATGEGTLVGDLSYFYTARDRCITLGITIAPEYQRLGFAFELLEAVVKNARHGHPQLDLVALIDPRNAASIALFEKLGFCRECYAETIDSLVYVLESIGVK